LQVYIGTNGCVEGQLSSKQIEQFFKMNEYTITTDSQNADIVVFWACGLTEPRQKDSLDIIKRIQANMDPTAKFIVWGCLPKINPQALRAVYDGPLIGSLDKKFFEGIPEKVIVPLDDIERAAAENDLISRDRSEDSGQKHIGRLTSTVLLYKQGKDKVSAHIKKSSKLFYISVATGCTGHCTYCSERPVYGKVKSRPMDEIISEFKEGLKQGYNRFSLIATDLGSYGIDIDCNLHELLGKMIKIENKKNYKIILNQVGFLQLKKISSDMEEIFASGKIEKLDCPVQCGSNRILKLMGRRHTAEEWREYMLGVNKKFPKIQLSTQFMVGFPTETDEDFKATLQLLDRPLVLDSIYVFKFSGRPAVGASKISGQVPEETKELRYKKLWQKYAYTYALKPRILKRS
jgi:threonylcarbamoyladenosine tRNA methylthiotransferase MtaB